MAMTPFLAVGLVAATAPVSVPTMGSLLLLGAAVVALQAAASTYDQWGPGLVQALRADTTPTEMDRSISGSVAQAIEQPATRTRNDRCARPVPKTVRPGGTVSVLFCAIPGQPLRSDTSAIAVMGGGPGTSVFVAVNAVGPMGVVAVMDFQNQWDNLATQVQTAIALPATLAVPLRPGRLMQLQGYSPETVPPFTYVPVTAR
jgi:hypothetical protein